MNNCDVCLAVRSSATTEDTADASFAGQHDTFLVRYSVVFSLSIDAVNQSNYIISTWIQHQMGADNVLSATRKCWASLFTDRAVLYRARNGVSHMEASKLNCFGFKF
jgi:phosphoenolpyruvate synthase/pyruvate phosphate dikinase